MGWLIVFAFLHWTRQATVPVLIICLTLHPLVTACSRVCYGLPLLPPTAVQLSIILCCRLISCILLTRLYHTRLFLLSCLWYLFHFILSLITMLVCVKCLMLYKFFKAIHFQSVYFSTLFLCYMFTSHTSELYNPVTSTVDCISFSLYYSVFDTPTCFILSLQGFPSFHLSLFSMFLP